MTRVAIISTALLATITAVVLTVHNVPREITDEDRAYIAKIMQASGYALEELSNNGPFDAQLRTIRVVQDAVLRATPVERGIGKRRTREPKDLYEAGHAQCGDRSRVIDKALRLLGFETRFVFLLETGSNGSALLSLVSDVRTHGVVEVRTLKGWLIVESIARWISLNAHGEPVSLAEWQREPAKMEYEWHPSNRDGRPYQLLDGPFTAVYGLYSRHGLFYPPYTPIPDLNWGELLANLE